MKILGILALTAVALTKGVCAGVVEGSPAGSATQPWVEPNFPFFSSVVYVPPSDGAFPGDNLTPRALVLNLGHDCWLAFDTELLRVAAVWQGSGLSPKALAPGSYADGTTKPPQSQKPAPEPQGTLWLTTGLYPGWQRSETLKLSDPRAPAPSPEEVGRGPLTEAQGKFRAVSMTSGGVILEYSVGGTKVEEWITSVVHDKIPVIERRLRMGAAAQSWTLLAGITRNQAATGWGGVSPSAVIVEHRDKDSLWLKIPPHRETIEFSVTLVPHGNAANIEARPFPEKPAAQRWSSEVVSEITESRESQAYVVDLIGLPINNPWGRRVRPGDIQFLSDGTGVLVTIDGDVWLARGIGEGKTVHWHRFASGLHEPFTAAIRENQIYVFDRNGIWRLRDTDGNGEADVHELFSNAFAQTADLREFATTVRVGPMGEFVIAKGGQQSVTQGKHNGSVLRVSPDGRSAEVLGYGFRQPAIAVHPREGWVTSSDQEGQYIPSTPLHLVRDGQFYGFLAPFLPREQYPAPIAEPIVWIPHTALASALSQVWMVGARMGPLNEGLVQIGFNRPELFSVLLNRRESRLQAAVVSVTKSFSFPPLNGAINPRDGQLYLAGFQVLGWGNVNNTEAGLARVRYTGKPVLLPSEVTAMQNGVLLRFQVPLDPKRASDPSSYSLASWHYRRTWQYGSPQLKSDGSSGQDFLGVSAAYLSQDRKSVFVAVPGLKPVQQLRVGWALTTAEGVTLTDNAALTPYVLSRFDPRAEGFGDLAIDLTPRAAPTPVPGNISVAEGARLAQLLGCSACHFEGENTRWAAKIGPSWRGLYGRNEQVMVGGEKLSVVADDAYLRESIVDPGAKIVAGYETGDAAMPSYAGVVTEDQLQALLLYLKSLR